MVLLRSPERNKTGNSLVVDTDNIHNGNEIVVKWLMTDRVSD